MSILLWMHTGYLKKKKKKYDRTFFFSFLTCPKIVSVYSGVSVYFATEQYKVHSRSEG